MVEHQRVTLVALSVHQHLLETKELRDQVMKHTPYAIGGEMEGWVLLELKRSLGQIDLPKHVKVIVIKGVADYGDLSKKDKLGSGLLPRQL